jgi:predicted nucleic acid-binding protein
MDRVLLDTSAVLRFLTNDDPRKAREVLQILEEREVIVTVATVIELVYVLKSKRHLYRWKKERIAEVLIDFLSLPNVYTEPYVIEAILLWKEYNLDDIEDAINCVLATKLDARLFTYDEDLNKVCREVVFNSNAKNLRV